ncbi:hypothetical protein QP150_01870 [Sphingomonas sp. 22L2VL55-3]
MAALSILIILHDFALGGTERVAVRLAGAWAKQGVAVTIFAGSDAGPLRALAGEAVEIVVAEPSIPRGSGSRKRLARKRARSSSSVGSTASSFPVISIGRSPPRWPDRAYPWSRRSAQRSTSRSAVVCGNGRSRSA